MRLLVRSIYFLLALLLAFAITQRAIEFFKPDFENHRFLTDKKEFFNIYKWPLYVHMLSAPLSILFGILQFTLPKRGFSHRLVGVFYIVVVICCAAPSGFVMAFFAIGGMPSVISFVLLSSLWWWFTIKAYRSARTQDFERHGYFMTMSFILANSAIILRLLGFVNKQWLHLEYETAYIWMTWLSWLPFLVIHQLSLRLKARRQAS